MANVPYLKQSDSTAVDTDIIVNNDTTAPYKITISVDLPELWIVAVEIKDEVSTINWFRVFSSREEAERYYNRLVELLPEKYKIYLAKVEKYSPVEVL